MNGAIASVQAQKAACELAGAERLKQEFQHLRSDWWWLLLYGVLLTMCGTVAIVVPPLATAGTMIVLGIVLIISGAATIVLSFWAGRWSGVLLYLLVGILYLVAGFAIFDTPIKATLVMTMFLAALFIVVGAFRILAAMMIRFPHWGWALLNGFVTLILGLIIYRRFPESAIWVLGLLVGVEMLFNGWNWIALSLAVRSIPEEKTA
jgi:uncharacterized membrane protein HdeD (DUF308 family)